MRLFPRLRQRIIRQLCDKPRQNRRSPSHYRPWLEALEDRWLPSTLTVTTAADSGPGSLRAEIATAQSGDTIVFDPGLNGRTITLTSGELAINKNVNIAGPGASQLFLNGNGSPFSPTGSRIFDVTSQNGTVSIAGLTIENGYTTGDGGGIENRGNLMVSGVTFSGNNAGNDGGGIENRGNLTVSGVTFSGNNAGNNGGAIENRGNLTMVGCIVGGEGPLSPFGNFANNDGGAVENRGTASISASVFTNNNGNLGGAIYNKGSLTVQNSSFDFNDDVGIFNLGTLALSGSTFSANETGDLWNLGTAVVSDQDINVIWNPGKLRVVDQSIVSLIYNKGDLTVSSDSTVDTIAQWP